MPLNSLLRVFSSKPTEPISRIKVGLVGAGRMGQLHAKKLSQNQAVELIGIADADAKRAQASAKNFKTSAYPNPEALIPHVQAVIIATPTPTHFALGKLFLESNVSCLIEKPLASNTAEAEELIRLADRHHCTLQVGHIERFNPAVIAAAEHIHAPQFIEVNRLGPYDPRVADIGVVMDLMIHDLDIVLFLVGEPVTRVEAFGAKVLSNHEDIAKVRLHFKNGCIADLSASRISMEKYRRIRIFQKNSYLSLDYAAPHLKIYRKKGETVKSLRDIEILKPKLASQDPLTLEHQHFLECVREGKTPLVSGKHGRDALELAREVLNNLQIHA